MSHFNFFPSSYSPNLAKCAWYSRYPTKWIAVARMIPAWISQHLPKIITIVIFQLAPHTLLRNPKVFKVLKAQEVLKVSGLLLKRVCTRKQAIMMKVNFCCYNMRCCWCGQWNVFLSRSHNNCGCKRGTHFCRSFPRAFYASLSTMEMSLLISRSKVKSQYRTVQ
jgi:hypothetical protein